MPTYTLDYDGGLSGHSGQTWGIIVGCRIANDDGTLTYVPVNGIGWADLLVGPLSGVSLDPVPIPLAIAQARAISVVRARTVDLLAGGFQWNGHTFSMDLASTQEWQDIFIGVSSGLETFPFSVGPTLDDGSSQTIPDSATWSAFMGAYKSRYAEIMGQPGTGGLGDLISQISSATSLSEVEAIKDDRV